MSVFRVAWVSPKPRPRLPERGPRGPGGERGNGQYSITGQWGGIEEATPWGRVPRPTVQLSKSVAFLWRGSHHLRSSKQIGCCDRSFARQRNGQASGLIIPSNLEGLDRVVGNGTRPDLPPVGHLYPKPHQVSWIRSPWCYGGMWVREIGKMDLYVCYKG